MVRKRNYCRCHAVKSSAIKATDGHCCTRPRKSLPEGKNAENPNGINVLRYVKTSPCWRCRGVSFVAWFLHENDFIANIRLVSRAVEQRARRTSGGRRGRQGGRRSGGGGGTGRRNDVVAVGTGRRNHSVAIGQHHDLRLFRNREQIGRGLHGKTKEPTHRGRDEGGFIDGSLHNL